MEPVIFLCGLFALYLCVFFFDRFFKSCMHYPYEAFLKNTGFTVEFLRLRWHTTAFNRAVLRWGTSGNCSRSLLTKSFTMGVIIAMSLLPIGIILLFVTIFNGGESSSSGGHSKHPGSEGAQWSNVKVEILLPGVNLPLEEIGYYITTLMLSSVVHEMGHALAAVLEDIPVTGFGVQVYFCLPLAYTEISTEHLNSLKWFRKLKILCGGIWHNFLFALVCYLFYSSLTLMSSPLYTFNKGVIITDVSETSTLRAKDHRGLSVDNIIAQINDCPVLNEDDWYGCLVKSLRSKPGYCVSSDFIRLNDESIEISHHGADGTLQCCDEKNEKVCCYEYIDDLSNDAPVEIPQHVCLDVRKTLEDSYDYCVAGSCDRGFCLRPLLRNTTTILSIKRFEEPSHDEHARKTLRNVIYIGHPADVSRSVRVSSFVPNQSYIGAKWADSYALFLKYNIVFSLGLALINAVPCLGFDGYHIINTITNGFLVNRVTERPKRDVIALIVSGIGTLFFALAVLKVLWLSVLRKLF